MTICFFASCLAAASSSPFRFASSRSDCSIVSAMRTSRSLRAGVVSMAAWRSASVRASTRSW
ncbi:Uncharacterised protein [Mycobacteroides abscessus subsp. abscessus]|nr:Uncharacterised protein [Mycobacteroides abscessus subsp. abscessus]